MNGAALRFAKRFTELSYSSLPYSDFNLSRATSKATTAMTGFGRMPQNDGDKVRYRNLPQPRQRR